MEIHIPEKTIPVLASCDVLVCGGGSAGVAAAVSAARHGASVVLVERWPVLGGMATAGLVNCFHRRDREKIVIKGLVEETVERLDRKGWIRLHVDEENVHETEWFEPEGMKIVWHRMASEAGVRIFCHLAAGELIMGKNRIQGVVVETKRGTKAILAGFVIDATGDGDVAARAGLEFDYGRTQDSKAQGMTMMYQLARIDDKKRRKILPEQAEEILRKMRALRDAGELPPFNDGFDPCGVPDLWWPNMCPASGNPLDEEELTRISVLAREQVHRYIQFYRENVPGFEKVVLTQTAFSLGIRESRRFHGIKMLNRDMVLGAVKQLDAVGHGMWMIDIHDPLGTGYTTHSDRSGKNMVPQGQSYHIPLGMCLNDRISNLAVVGRCASSTHEAHASVRVMSHCMVMGQGVGTAVAMTLSGDCNILDVEFESLQEKLKNDGVYLEDIPVGMDAA